VYLRPYYCDSEELNVKLGPGIFYSDSYFATDVEVKEYGGIKPSIDRIKG